MEKPQFSDPQTTGGDHEPLLVFGSEHIWYDLRLTPFTTWEQFRAMLVKVEMAFTVNEEVFNTLDDFEKNGFEIIKRDD